MNLKGMFTYFGEKLEKEIFQIYKCLTGNNPIAQNILLCNKDTKNEEIISFLFRAFLCNYNSCFIIGGLESLYSEQKNCILNILDYLYDNKGKVYESCVIFLYTDKDSDIAKGLENKKYRKVLSIKGKFESEKYIGTNIEVIKSDQSGVGKSTKIKNDILKCKKSWVYFPLSGVFSREDIIRRFKALQIDNNCILHIDLYDTDQITLMQEFLFSILITRYYCKNEDIFYLSKDIQIKVEIPNMFINFFAKFPILSLFEIKEMKISELPPLIVPDKLDSNIKIVSNYLKALKEDKISRYDLIFPNITPDDLKENNIRYRGKILKTSIKAQLLSADECQKLIFDVIKERIKEPNYYQITAFINVLALQLIKFNKNFYLNVYQLFLSGNNKNCIIRNLMVEYFIKQTKYFIEGAFTELLKCRKNEDKSLIGTYNEEEDIKKAIDNLAHTYLAFSLNTICHSLIFFNEGYNDQTFTIITNQNKNTKEYNDLLNIKNMQFNSRESNLMFKELPNYNNYTQLQFLEQLKEILDVKNPVEKNVKEYSRISLEEIAGNYVFTLNNYLQMVLILLRINSNIPVIMMGGDAVGKLSLIRKLSELKNEGNSNKLKILNLHSEIYDNDIIDFLNQVVIPEAKYEKEKNRNERENIFFNENKIWVFFNDINSSKSMGLINELMCKHTCQGKPLPSNIVFIGACNPYKQSKKINHVEQKIGLDINQAHKQILKYLSAKELDFINKVKNKNNIYTLYPLPHSLLNFVFDFGSLTSAGENMYIGVIIKEAIKKKYYKDERIVDDKNQYNNLNKLISLAKNLIIRAKEYIESLNDEYSVSLREIRKFNIIYEFFYDYLRKKKEIYEKESDNNYYKNLDDYKMQVYAINLSIYVCYYLRLTHKKNREGLYKIFNKIFNEFSSEFKIKDFLDLPLNEEKFLVENMKLSKGIACNKQLLENIFLLFVAINNKIPIFIVGNPGSSKSLSIQLIINSMKGSSSDNIFFKNCPNLILSSYQCSLSSSQNDIYYFLKKSLSEFHNLPEYEKQKNILLVLFNEIGLAANSPNNALKDIYLDFISQYNKYAFIGISNWSFDVYEMNRSIFIFIQDYDQDEINNISLSIGESYDKLLIKEYKSFYENLGKAYFNYKEYLKKNHNLDGKYNFHGNRDFYFLIKNLSKDLISKKIHNQLDDISMLECGVSSIERNLSGIQFVENKTSLEVFKSIFKEMYPECKVKKEYNIIKRINENINDIDSRYLLLISKSFIYTFLLSSILSNNQKKYKFYIGSQFEEDLNSELYSLQILNKIKTDMGKENILILKNLDSIYPSLSDLFNQNFTVVENKNYSRLFIGSNNNIMAYVNNNFKCIISMDNNQIENEEPPFLNKFEKHIISFEYLLDEELIKESNNIKSTLDSLVEEDNSNNNIYDLKTLLINSNIEEIQALVYQAKKEEKNKEDINNYVFQKISLTLPQDIITNMETKFKQNRHKDYENIVEFYKKGEHSNFANFLKTMDNYKNIIYTFSNILDKMKNIEGINNPLIEIIEEKNIKIIQINTIKSESDLERQLDDFFNDDNKKILVIKFLPYEGNIINYLKYFIDNKEKDYENKHKKVFIFIVYMEKVLKSELNQKENMTLKEQNAIEKKILNESLSNLSGYYQIFIDNLNED